MSARRRAWTSRQCARIFTRQRKGSSRLTRVFRFYNYIYTQRKNYDTVFVHMNPEYILLGSFLWHRRHKPVSLWYAHKSVTWKLRQALKRVTHVFSVSDTSFAIPTPKL